MFISIFVISACEMSVPRRRGDINHNLNMAVLRRRVAGNKSIQEGRILFGMISKGTYVHYKYALLSNKSAPWRRSDSKYNNAKWLCLGAADRLYCNRQSVIH